MYPPFQKRAPGICFVEFIGRRAGRSGRSALVEFTSCVATAFEMRAPGIRYMEFITIVAGRGGRIWVVEFTSPLATAFEIGAPGTHRLEFTPLLAGRGGRSDRLEIVTSMATALRLFIGDISNTAIRSAVSDSRVSFRAARKCRAAQAASADGAGTALPAGGLYEPPLTPSHPPRSCFLLG